MELSSTEDDFLVVHWDKEERSFKLECCHAWSTNFNYVVNIYLDDGIVEELSTLNIRGQKNTPPHFDELYYESICLNKKFE